MIHAASGDLTYYGASMVTAATFDFASMLNYIERLGIHALLSTPEVLTMLLKRREVDVHVPFSTLVVIFSSTFQSADMWIAPGMLSLTQSLNILHPEGKIKEYLRQLKKL